MVPNLLSLEQKHVLFFPVTAMSLFNSFINLMSDWTCIWNHKSRWSWRKRNARHQASQRWTKSSRRELTQMIYNYYSFKIFPRFWLAKSTRIIHHNKLLTTDDVKSAASLQVHATLTEKTRGRGWVVLVVKTKMADISLLSRVRTRRNNSSKHGKNSKKTTRRATPAIWRIFP